MKQAGRAMLLYECPDRCGQKQSSSVQLLQCIDLLLAPAESFGKGFSSSSLVPIKSVYNIGFLVLYANSVISNQLCMSHSEILGA